MLDESVYQVKSLKDLKGLHRRMKLGVKAGAFDAEVGRRLKQQQKKAKLSGFRPGKAPLPVIERTYGAGIRSDAAMELVRQASLGALDKKGLELATQMQVTDLVPPAAGKDLAATVEFEVYPTFKLAPLKKIELQKQVAEITEEDLQQLLESWQQQSVTYDAREADDPSQAQSQDGDRLQLRMQLRALAESQPEEEPKAQEIYALVGGGRFPSELEEVLPGLCVGDERQVRVQPPAQEGEGAPPAPMEYSFQVLQVEKPYVPSLQEMAASLESEDGKSGIELLKERATDYLRQQSETLTANKLQQAALQGLAEANAKVPLPEGLVANETDMLTQSTCERYNLEPDSLPEAAVKDIAEQARSRVHLSILLRQMTKEHELQPADSDMQELIAADASRYGDQAEGFHKWALGNRDYLRQVQARAIERAAVTAIVAQGKITEQALSLEELQGN